MRRVKNSIRIMLGIKEECPIRISWLDKAFKPSISDVGIPDVEPVSRSFDKLVKDILSA